MDGFLAPLRFILNLFNRSKSTNNRTVQARDIRNNEGPVTIDQSIGNLTINSPADTAEKRRRDDAAQGIWNMVIDLKTNSKTAVMIMDLFHPDNEISKLNQNQYFSATKKDLDDEGMLRYMKVVEGSEKHRPFISDRLWNLFQAYQILSMRPALLLSGVRGKAPTTTWWEDELIKRSLAREGMPKEMEELSRSSQTPLKKCKDRIEEEIRLDMQSADNSL